jgi:hypothetical protein
MQPGAGGKRMPDVKVLKIRTTGGDPEMEIVFGQAQVGVYRAFRWDANAANPTQIGFGNNIDDLSDRFPVGLTATALDQSFATWEAIVQPPDSSAGQLYSVFVTFRQDGNVVPDGIFQYTGQLSGDSKAISGSVRFQAI